MTPPADSLVPLAAATDVDTAGAKAASLARAISDGHPVPDGVVVPIDLAHAITTSPHGAEAAALCGLVERWGGLVAVRSSGVAEDGARESLAGRYTTVLGVASDTDLIDAVARCVRSSRTDATTTDRPDPPPSMAVIVQHMLRPTAAGVAFSTDPVTGDDHVVIEAIDGLADEMLAGTIDGERWIVDGEPTADTNGPTTLDSHDARRIAALCRRLAHERRHPVDIEWAIEDETLWLLQVRPITALPSQPTDELPIGQTYVREPRIDRPLPPLSFTTWFPIHRAAMKDVFEEFGIPATTIDSRLHRGRVFGRLIPLNDRGSDGREPPLSLVKLLMHITPTVRRRLRRGAAWDGERRITALIDKWERFGRDRCRERTMELRRFDVGHATDVELADHIDGIRAHLLDVAREHFRMSVGATSLPAGRLGLFVENRLGWTTSELLDLVQGSGQASTAHGDAIQELFDRLGNKTVDRVIADPATINEHPAGRNYLERFGHVVHIDLATPTEADDPSHTASHLRRARYAGRARRSDPAAAAAEAEARALTELGSDADRAAFRRLLDLARRGRPYGDETETVALSALSPMRKVALEAGRRWADAGRLHDIDDVWFLELDELGSMLRSPDTRQPDIKRRRAEHRWNQAHPVPDRVGPPPAPMLPPSIAGRKYATTLGAVLWAFAAAEGRPVDQPDVEDVLRGLPGSPGVATGPVRTVRNESEFNQVVPGEIVVCVVATAAWSPIFPTIGGLVTEHGGPLSHPATLAREYGLPAVLAVRDATHRLENGTHVRIDGATGVIELLK